MGYEILKFLLPLKWPQQSTQHYYQNLLLLKLFEDCQDKRVNFFLEYCASSFVCFGLCIKEIE